MDSGIGSPRLIRILIATPAEPFLMLTKVKNQPDFYVSRRTSLRAMAVDNDEAAERDNEWLA